MLKIQSRINHKKWIALARNIESFISSRKKVFTYITDKKCPVYLERYIPAQNKRRDKTQRYACFFAGLDIIRKASVWDVVCRQGTEWEILWMTPEKEIIAVHIREERIQNDRVLFLISTFEKT
jgi:hypothetical protein